MRHRKKSSDICPKIYYKTAFDRLGDGSFYETAVLERVLYFSKHYLLIRDYFGKQHKAVLCFHPFYMDIYVIALAYRIVIGVFGGFLFRYDPFRLVINIYKYVPVALAQYFSFYYHAVSDHLSSPIFLIFITTSSIKPAGVDAPALTPALFFPLNQLFFSSFAPSTWYTSLSIPALISNSLLVFALFFPPTMTMISDFFASSKVAFCLFFVASHMVLKTRTSAHQFKKAFSSMPFIIALYVPAFCVVCETIPVFSFMSRLFISFTELPTPPLPAV